MTLSIYDVGRAAASMHTPRNYDMWGKADQQELLSCSGLTAAQ